jgi:hypothetical protein
MRQRRRLRQSAHQPLGKAMIRDAMATRIDDVRTYDVLPQDTEQPPFIERGC